MCVCVSNCLANLFTCAERLKEKAPEAEVVRRAGVADIPLETTETRMRRAVIRKKIHKWPNATVPYDFDVNFRKSY